MATAITVSHRHETSQPNNPKTQSGQSSAIAHAVRLIHAVCGLAGSPTLIDDIRANLRADKVRAAIRNRDSAVVFDWLMAALSYQGIADQVAYGYRDGGCADIIAAVAERIDARQFNPAFPQTFPRFVQYAVWRYCAQNGLDVCNGNRINDAKRCGNLDCRVRLMCDRVALRKASEN